MQENPAFVVQQSLNATVLCEETQCSGFHVGHQNEFAGTMDGDEAFQLVKCRGLRRKRLDPLTEGGRAGKHVGHGHTKHHLRDGLSL